jgi:hypothetical protein
MARLVRGAESAIYSCGGLMSKSSLTATTFRRVIVGLVGVGVFAVLWCVQPGFSTSETS